MTYIFDTMGGKQGRACSLLATTSNNEQCHWLLREGHRAQAGLLFAGSAPGFQEGCWVIMWGEHIIMALLREGEGAL